MTASGAHGTRLSLIAALLGTVLVVGPVDADRRGGTSDPPPPPATAEPDTTLPDDTATAPSVDDAAALDAPDDPGAAPADSVAAAPDTTSTPVTTQPGRAATFRSTYTTIFKVNRSVETWIQTLNMSLVSPDGARIDNATTITLGKDDALGRDTRNRRSTIGLTLPLSHLVTDSLAFDAELVIGRNVTIDRGQTDSRSDIDQFRGALVYTRLLGEGLTSTFDIDFGTADTETVDPRTSTRRISSGPYAQTSAVLDLGAGGWTGTLSARVRSERLDSIEAITGTRTDDANRDTDMGLSFNLDLPGFESVKLTLDRTLARKQQPLLLAAGPDSLTAGQDNTRQLTNRFGLDAAASPAPRLDLTASVSWQDLDIDRDLDRLRSQQSIDRDLKGELKYQFGDSTRVSAKFNQGVRRSLFDADTRRFLNGRIETNSVAGTFSRPLGDRTEVRAGGTYQVQSYLYDDTVANDNDRDLVQGDFNATAEYTPHPDVDTKLLFTVKHVQTIHISGTRSAGNTTQQTFTIGPQVEYRITPKLTFREDASVIAIAKVFSFDEDRSQLSRTTALNSSVIFKAFRNLSMEMAYAYRIVLDGSYRRIDGLRRFGKASDALTRDLRLNASYNPIPTGTLRLDYNRRLGDTIIFTRQQDDTIETLALNEYTEVTAGATLGNVALDLGPTVRGSIERVENWTGTGIRNRYWYGEITVNQTF